MMGEEDLIDKLSSKITYIKSILFNIPGCIYWKDISGTYMGCNKIFLKMVGLESDKDIIGKTDKDFCWKDQADNLKNHDLKVIQSAKTLVLEEEVNLANGCKKLYSVIKSPLFDENNVIIGIVGTSVDISYRKSIEDDLKVEKVKAEASNKAKSEFIANMSHDLRTPITGILGIVQDMINNAENIEINNSSKDSALRDMLDMVKRNGDYLLGATGELLNLCNEILEVAQLKSCKLEDSMESFDLHSVILHNVQLLKPVACHKNLQLEYEIDSSLPECLSGARVYLDRILLNIIGNALKFTDDGSVKIYVKLLSDYNVNLGVGEDVTVKIMIEDTGIGIPEDKFEAIFEQFSRLTPSYEGLYKGAGLGLYTVKRYIKYMNGTIDVSSKLNQGTCFSITLPFKISSRKLISKAKNKNWELKIEDSTIISDNVISILLVEDHMLAAIAVSTVLESFNCKIERAENGEQAVRMAELGNYDLILMDIGLPDFSGIEATKKIRALKDNFKSKTPIVALTGHANNPEMRQEALDAGLQEVLSKPAQASELKSIIQKYVFNLEVKDSEPSNDLLVIDWDKCVLIFNGDVEFTRKMLFIMSEDLSNAKNVLSNAYIKRDFEALRAELHRCYGGICYLKLPELENALERFHLAVKDSPQDELLLSKTYKALQGAIENFQQTLAKELK